MLGTKMVESTLAKEIRGGRCSKKRQMVPRSKLESSVGDQVVRNLTNPVFIHR